VSIVVGTVLLETKIGGSLDSAERTTAELGVYSNAFRRMWIFYTAMTGTMFLIAVVIMMRKSKEVGVWRLWGEEAS
jgi:hypothetical protein